ncbi:zinc finger protein 546 [Rhagoletis pomonella]|uniref:zinc finger protein 546 n=1 Tax=Rhagoletis pomonella TaxID=28610 RepID=UPI00177BC6F4|nr:zinc finger protein 546 [Rhagoletis pomonella]
MIDPDLDDTHLCIKCSTTIVGLEAYIEHRKTRCTKLSSAAVRTNKRGHVSPHAVPTEIISTPRAHLDHTYDAFAFTEPPESYAKEATHGGKTSKSLADAYELPYELGADVFFSSLQLQSVQAAGPSTSGKQGMGAAHSQPSTSLQQRHDKTEHADPIGPQPDEPWMSEAHASGSNAQQQKSYDDFKPMAFEQESPEASEEEEEDVDAEMEEDEEDYDPIAAAHATGGKWKPPAMPHSPPVVPETHTGGKWRPENRPTLHVAHTQLARISPNWDEHAYELENAEAHEGQHPPAEHTKGKWIPGTKMQRLEYKEEVVELAKSANQEYWCNICCRRLKSKTNYENHLKTGYHKKRAEPERQLEKATLDDIQRGDLSKSFTLALEEPQPSTSGGVNKKRKRRANLIRCQLCKHSMLRHLVGKHLISHFHYRRMQMNPAKSLPMILQNIHSVVLQSPFQCRPCRFYTNTEEMFLQHWSSPEHLDASEGLGKFWCSYCHFECEDNNQMRRHLLSAEHKEVILAINRSVPICISKKLSIDCTRCRQSFRYNVELRRHMLLCHPDKQLCGTASDTYQSRYKCGLCAEYLHSKVALQRHEKNRHSISKYFCSICKLEFNTPCKARRHRKTAEHRASAAAAETSADKRRKRETTKCVKSCDKCNFVASSVVEAMLHELSHPKAEPTRSTVIIKATSSNDRASASTDTSKPTERVQKSLANEKQVPVKCKDCDELCASKEALKTHRDTSHPLLCHICLSCGESFALAQALGRHTRHCQPKASTSKEALQSTGDKQVQSSSRWSCEDCDFSAPYESELIFHRLHHTYGPMSKNQIIACPICSKEFRKHSLRCHLRQHTNEKIFVCELCDLKFSRRHNLKDHMKSIHGVPPVGVTKDQQTTSTTEESTKPKKRKTDGGNFACDTCSKTFASEYMLKKHTASHIALPSATRESVCTNEGCRYVAANPTLLRIHAASHAKEQLKCKESSCNYQGKSVLHLKRHAATHLAPTKWFACDKCEFKARIKGHIKRHMRTHTGEKPFACPHCSFRCSTFDNLRKHVLKTGKHPGKFIYECERCIFKTNSYQEFQKHIGEKHTG